MATYYVRQLYVNENNRKLDWPRDYVEDFDGSAEELLETLLQHTRLEAESDVQDGCALKDLFMEHTTYEIYADKEYKTLLCSKTINHLDGFNELQLTYDNEEDE